MKNKIFLSIILAVISIFTAIGTYAFDEDDIPLYDWDSELHFYIQNGEITIIGPDSNTTRTAFTIPSSIDGYPVTRVAGFSLMSQVKSVTIPDSVTTIASNAFKDCKGLTTIKLPSKLQTIEKSAFKGCTALTTITIPDTVTSIGSEAFSDCVKLSAVTLSKKLSSISMSLFYNCSSLKSITLPANITAIYDYAFFGCKGLTTISFPSKVTKIGTGAFGKTGLTSVIISDHITSLGNSVFYECTSLKNATIGSGVTSIPMQTFYDCYNLKWVRFTRNVTEIGTNAFAYADNLENIYFVGTKDDFDAIVLSTGNVPYYRTENFYEATQTTTSTSGRDFTVVSSGLKKGNVVILALYNGDRLVETQFLTYQNEDVEFKTDKVYTSSKVFVWDSIENPKPVCSAETLK